MSNVARPESEPKTALAARLRDLRREAGDLEREALAEKIGVSKSTLASYERGESEPTASPLAGYRREFNVNLNWLVCGEGDKNETARPVSGRAAQLLADFEKLPEDRQLDILDIVTINLKRAGRE